MPPIDVPNHWKRIEDILERTLQEDGDESGDDESVDEFEDSSEEIIIILTDDEDSELASLLSMEDFSDSEADDIIYIHLPEENLGNVTPVLPDTPNVRRRLFEVSSSDEDDIGVLNDEEENSP